MLMGFQEALWGLTFRKGEAGKDRKQCPALTRNLTWTLGELVLLHDIFMMNKSVE